jgi:hypothetical protein
MKGKIHLNLQKQNDPESTDSNTKDNQMVILEKANNEIIAIPLQLIVSIRERKPLKIVYRSIIRINPIQTVKVL